MGKDKQNVVYSTDSLEHKENFDKVSEEVYDDIGLRQDEDGTWSIKEELM